MSKGIEILLWIIGIAFLIIFISVFVYNSREKMDAGGQWRKKMRQIKIEKRFLKSFLIYQHGRLCGSILDYKILPPNFRLITTCNFKYMSGNFSDSLASFNSFDLTGALQSIDEGSLSDQHICVSSGNLTNQGINGYIDLWLTSDAINPWITDKATLTKHYTAEEYLKSKTDKWAFGTNVDGIVELGTGLSMLKSAYDATVFDRDRQPVMEYLITDPYFLSKPKDIQVKLSDKLVDLYPFELEPGGYTDLRGTDPDIDNLLDYLESGPYKKYHNLNTLYNASERTDTLLAAAETHANPLKKAPKTFRDRMLGATNIYRLEEYLGLGKPRSELCLKFHHLYENFIMLLKRLQRYIPGLKVDSLNKEYFLTSVLLKIPDSIYQTIDKITSLECVYTSYIESTDPLEEIIEVQNMIGISDNDLIKLRGEETGKVENLTVDIRIQGMRIICYNMYNDIIINILKNIPELGIDSQPSINMESLVQDENVLLALRGISRHRVSREVIQRYTRLKCDEEDPHHKGIKLSDVIRVLRSKYPLNNMITVFLIACHATKEGLRKKQSIPTIRKYINRYQEADKEIFIKIAEDSLKKKELSTADALQYHPEMLSGEEQEEQVQYDPETLLDWDIMDQLIAEHDAAAAAAAVTEEQVQYDPETLSEEEQLKQAYELSKTDALQYHPETLSEEEQLKQAMEKSFYDWHTG